MAKFNKGTRLVCIPCGREIMIDACGVSAQTLWCCGKPMASKKKSAQKTSARRKKA